MNHETQRLESALAIAKDDLLHQLTRQTSSKHDLVEAIERLVDAKVSLRLASSAPASQE